MKKIFNQKSDIINIDLIRKFIHSPYYIALLGMFAAMGSLYKSANLAICFLVIITVSGLFLSKSLYPLIPFLCIFVFSLEPTTSFKDSLIKYYTTSIVAIVMLFICIGVYFIAFKPKFRFGKLTLPLLAVSIAFIFSGVGINEPDMVAGNLGWGFLLGFGSLAIYLIAVNCFDSYKDYSKLIAFIGVTIGVVVTLQLLNCVVKEDFVTIINNKAIFLGWGVSNSVGCVLLMMAPLAFYLSCNSKFSLIYCLIGMIFLLLVPISGSRGSMLAEAILIPVLGIYTLIKTKHKVSFFISVIIIVAVTLTIIFIFKDEFAVIIDRILDKGLNVSGRDDLYKEAIEHFKKFPIFGVGMDYLGKLYNKPLYWYHSTVFQVLASLGVVGIITFAIKYFVQFKILIRKNLFNIFMLFVFFAYEFYSMADVMTFTFAPFVMISYIFIAGVEHYNGSHRYLPRLI